jgi:hypothetical protein
VLKAGVSAIKPFIPGTCNLWPMNHSFDRKSCNDSLRIRSFQRPVFYFMSSCLFENQV